MVPDRTSRNGWRIYVGVVFDGFSLVFQAFSDFGGLKVAKTRQDAPSGAQDGPKTTQEAAKRRQDAPKTPQDDAKSRPRRPKMPPEPPRTAKMTRKFSQVGMKIAYKIDVNFQK